jgi:hypothetical protein
MLQASKQLNIDLWEAWIEFDLLHPENFGVLYVSGDLPVNKQTRQPLAIQKMEQHVLTNTLVLRIDANADEDGIPEEIMYSEPIVNLNQYSSVVIYVKDEIVAVMRDIEIMV